MDFRIPTTSGMQYAATSGEIFFFCGWVAKTIGREADFSAPAGRYEMTNKKAFAHSANAQVTSGTRGTPVHGLNAKQKPRRLFLRGLLVAYSWLVLFRKCVGFVIHLIRS